MQEKMHIFAPSFYVFHDFHVYQIDSNVCVFFVFTDTSTGFCHKNGALKIVCESV